MVEELCTTRNLMTDKTKTSYSLIKQLLGDSISFNQADNEAMQWKAKRKTLSQAFYKGRVEYLMDVMVQTSRAKVEEIKKKIDASPNGEVVLNYDE